MFKMFKKKKHRIKKGRITVAQLAAKLMVADRVESLASEAITQIIPISAPNVVKRVPPGATMMLSGHTFTQPIPSWRVVGV